MVGGLEAAPLVDGPWMIRGLVLNIFDCASLVCGRIVWLEDPAGGHRNAAKRSYRVWSCRARPFGPAARSGILTTASLREPDDWRTPRRRHVPTHGL